MAFLRNSLNLAEKFLDGLDKKADPSGIVAPPSSTDKPFTRRSTSTSSFGGGGDSLLSPTTPGRLHASASQSFDRDSEAASEAIAPGSPGRRAHDAVEAAAAASGKLDAAAARSSTDDAQDAPALPTRTRRNSQSRDADADTAAALLHAVQEKDARILQLTLQNEELRRLQRDFEADLNDLEAELRAAVAERDRAKKQESSLEQQIKDAYAESATARARMEALQEDLARCDPKFYGKLEAQVEGLQTELDALRDQLLRAEQSRAQAQEQLTSFRAAAQRYVCVLKLLVVHCLCCCLCCVSLALRANDCKEVAL